MFGRIHESLLQSWMGVILVFGGERVRTVLRTAQTSVSTSRTGRFSPSENAGST
jgi:hypothetical protein